MKETDQTQRSLLSLSLAALGIVFGDIGTSPLYAMRASLGHMSINTIDILGVLSLIFWTLILVISIKYLIVVFRADNHGEGGILALLALLKRSNAKPLKLLFIIGIFGAGLMLGDGMITPAVSVLSAVEGLHVIAPHLSGWVLPLAFFILVILFAVQSFGSAKIGVTFGPILLLWFVTAAVLGGIHIFQNPAVLKAINPYFAYYFLAHHKLAYVVLGGVFLVATGGESLYADLGHFGKNPIRIGWFFIALPSLVINYFGQGAYLLHHPEAIQNPFYMMAARWFLIPLLILATAATIIASQAVISATFSLTKQAVLLGLYPRLPIRQTSDSMEGQIYVPQMNIVLAIGTLLLVLMFKSSDALTHAYGIAVNLTMLLTTLMVGFAAYTLWQWNLFSVLMLFALFLFIDVSFLFANVQKISTGGWVPILFALACAFIMYTWNKGMMYFRKSYYEKEESLSTVITKMENKPISRLSGITAIFITDVYDKMGVGLFHFLSLNHMLPEKVLMVNYKIESIPHVKASDRYQLVALSENIYQLTLHYGFMEFISVPQALSRANKRDILPFNIDVKSATYFVEIHYIMPSYRKKTTLFFFQKKLFSFLMRNYSANLDIQFYQLPYDRTIAIGTYHVI